MTLLTNDTDIELFNSHRNVQTIHDNQQREIDMWWSREKTTKERWAKVRSEDVSHAIIDRVFPRLLDEHPHFGVMPLPSFYLVGPDKLTQPVSAFTALMKVAGYFSMSDIVLVEIFSQAYYREYSYWLSESHVSVYLPITGMMFDRHMWVTDPQTKMERFGVMTRYGKYHFDNYTYPTWDFNAPPTL